MLNLSLIFTLLVIFQLKHFLADYPLQNGYMLGKFKGGKDWILPLTAHAGVHALFTLFICLLVNANLWYLAIVDFVLHFVMDRAKASPNLLGRFKAVSAAEFKSFQSILSYRPGTPEIDLAKKNIKEKLKSNTHFWWALGFDQSFHHLTHYLIIYILVYAS